MKVLLIQDVENLGMAGDVKHVADGFGRNYLIPKGFAVLATDGAQKQAGLHRRRAADRRQRLADEMAALAKAVSQTKLVFQSKAGEKGRLYGSVTTADISDRLTRAVGQEIDRRKIVLDGAIKQIGTHKAVLRLSADAVAEFDVVVESLEGETQVSPDEEKAVEDVEPVVEPAEAGE